MPEISTIADLLVGLDNTNVRASTGKRFVNYIIDITFFYIIILALAFVWALISPETIDNYAESQGGINFIEQIIFLILYAVFMFVQEALTKGRSLGKFITGTKVLNLNGTEITKLTALARGFSRAVPFCVFSALGKPCNPWQDKWTDTMVIDKKLSEVF